jgi:hypothetical protein
MVGRYFDDPVGCECSVSNVEDDMAWLQFLRRVALHDEDIAWLNGRQHAAAGNAQPSRTYSAHHIS